MYKRKDNKCIPSKSEGELKFVV
ncbi:MAG: hypothetical protein ACD_16C00043G0001, partial [uncultured bacterium]